jgi:hypothetical protein
MRREFCNTVSLASLWPTDCSHFDAHGQFSPAGRPGQAIFAQRVEKMNQNQPHSTGWAASIPDDQWAIYEKVIDTAHRRGIRFALGGAFALAFYTGNWRNSKDMDMYVVRRDRAAITRLLSDVGLKDYFDVQSYDREWIYRSHRDHVIVDVIWAMANHSADVDHLWLDRAPETYIRGVKVRIVPAEEMVWAKLYVMQRDRCDWPDIINLLYATGPTLDWKHLFARIGGHRLLLQGVMYVFAWLFPHRLKEFPAWVRRDLNAVRADDPGDTCEHRLCLLDSRPWFRLPTQESNAA